ncbi:MAG: chemotaxis-specific protein-glutamate methyltransferase CheB [Gaiella sp.]
MSGATSPRVVVAADSRLMRRMLVNGLVREDMDVVGEASDGDEALALCRELSPDALSLDLAMPGTDGLVVLRTLRDASSPIPVVVVSAFSPVQGARAVDALAEGAVDLVAKPAAGGPFDQFARDLASKLRAAASSRVRRAVKTSPAAPAHPAHGRRAGTGTLRRVVIACSTGGPRALAEVLPGLPERVGDGVLIVQHMPPGFTGSLAARLDRASAVSVREAKDGDRLDAGAALIAPGGKHVRIGSDGTLRVTDDEPVGGLKPRADLAIVDAAETFGPELLLVVLTGMGRDATEGAEHVKRREGTVIAESEQTCTVYGMPRSVIEAGLADHVLPLDEIADAIAREAGP